MAMYGLPSSGMAPRPLCHEHLPRALEPVARWTYRHLGNLFQPTYEQWEIEFLRETHPGKEIAAWAKMTWAVLEFLQRHPHCDKRAIADFVLLMRAGHEPGSIGVEVEREVRALLASPPPEMANPSSKIYLT